MCQCDRLMISRRDVIVSRSSAHALASTRDALHAAAAAAAARPAQVVGRPSERACPPARPAGEWACQ